MTFLPPEIIYSFAQKRLGEKKKFFFVGKWWKFFFSPSGFPLD
jgi:hypothetical protein